MYHLSTEMLKWLGCLEMQWNLSECITADGTKVVCRKLAWHILMRWYSVARCCRGQCMIVNVVSLPWPLHIALGKTSFSIARPQSNVTIKVRPHIWLYILKNIQIIYMDIRRLIWVGVVRWKFDSTPHTRCKMLSNPSLPHIYAKRTLGWGQKICDILVDAKL